MANDNDEQWNHVGKEGGYILITGMGHNAHTLFLLESCAQKRELNVRKGKRQ